jgi:hypothetical protein
MENVYDFNDWLDGSAAFNSPGDSTAAEQAGPAPDQVDQPSGGQALPLLRLGAWKSNQQCDKNNPTCIHYDFRWKVSHRENIRARHVCSDTEPDLVLAPSDFWKVDFQARLESLLKDKNKFPGESYTCEETIVEISIERSRQRGLTKRWNKLEIDWQPVDDHLEGLSNLFSKGRKITLGMEFVYKEVICESTTAKGKKRKSATEAQRLQRAAEAGLWVRVYERYRCRAIHCKQGPHCWPDEQGNHRELLPRHLEDIVSYIKGNMKEGEKEVDVDINIKIPPSIIKDVLDNSRKRKADGSIDCPPCKAYKVLRCSHR